MVEQSAGNNPFSMAADTMGERRPRLSSAWTARLNGEA
jgi:hypothetical protein